MRINRARFALNAVVYFAVIFSNINHLSAAEQRPQAVIDRVYAKLFRHYYMEIRKGGFEKIETECYYAIFEYWLGAYRIKSHAPSLDLERFIFTYLAPLVIDKSNPLKELRVIENMIFDSKGRLQDIDLSKEILGLQGEELKNFKSTMLEFAAFVSKRMESPKTIGLENL